MKRLALRRALHACVDLVLDALELDANDGEKVPAKRPRAFARPPVELPPGVTNEEVKATRERLEKQGYRNNSQSAA